ncbi:N-acetyltransferase family protein [Nocardia sp. CA-145437]|uniref:GNAT family N-acetyltransferase n=1 Tax=Nocardia sp. CA-145437 TaxID=3239980 RepID=UPI003D970454
MIRRATPDDVPALVGLVHDLAEYEKAPEECTLTEEQLRIALFGPTPALYAHVAESDHGVVGCAIWFLNYSTWKGVHGIYLEDLYVKPEARGRGLGKSLLATLAREAVEQGYARVDWSVLTWNTPSIDFYRSIGAEHQHEWTGYRLAGAPLARLATHADD